MLHYETITERVKSLLNCLMKHEDLQEFRLVGGTALSLYKGHRKSEDIDLFIDGYDKYNKEKAIEALKDIKPKEAQMQIRTNLSFGVMAYLQFNSPEEEIKIDIMNFDSDPFIHPPFITDNIRLASLEDIAAMKLNSMIERKNKKDYVDIEELLQNYTIKEMIEFYQQRFPYFDKKEVVTGLSQIDKAKSSIMPVMLNQKTWETICDNIKKELSNFMNS